MLRVAYVSRALRTYSHGELRAMCDQFAARNRAIGVTGVLVRIGDHYVQAFEGDRHTVEHLYRKIQCDPRHTEVTTLFRMSDDYRAFAGWSMHFYDGGSQSCENADPLVDLCNRIENAAMLRRERNRVRSILLEHMGAKMERSMKLARCR